MFRFLCFITLMFSQGLANAGYEHCQTISGTVEVNNQPLPHAKVKLFEALDNHSRFLEKAVSNDHGKFELSYQSKNGSPLFIIARDPCRPEIVLVAAFDACNPPQPIVINELSTVATAYAVSQFIQGNKIFGPSPGLDNAVGTIGNLVNLSTGKPGRIISNRQNGASGLNERSTLAEPTQNTIANLISGCATSQDLCTAIFNAISQNGQSIRNTFQAIHTLARNPFTQDDQALYDLSRVVETFEPTLQSAPESWILALHHVKGGFSAPGRMAFDSRGNVWINNNWLPPAGSSANIPGRQFTVLNPQGKPILGSPIFSKFVHGSGYGIAIDQKDRTWIASFNDGQIARFNPKGKVQVHSDGLNHPMGIAVDQRGNLWIPNMGDPQDDQDAGSVTVFIKGDPNNRVTQTAGIFKPFSLAIDDKGRCWVDNGAFTPSGSATILKLTKDNEIQIVRENLTTTSSGSPDFPISSNFVAPITVAIDANGNGWISNFGIPEVTFINGKTYEVTNFPVDTRSRGWGLAVDGGGLVWIQSFAQALQPEIFREPPIVISVVSARENDLGAFLYSFTNPALQHATGLQIDQSGNIWVANNWSLESMPPSPLFSGDGVVEFIGLATPVTTPLIGQPVNPADLKSRRR